MATTHLIMPGVIVVADIRAAIGGTDRLMAGPDKDGDYRDLSGDGGYYTPSELTNIRPAAVLTVPAVSGSQRLGDLTMYNLSNGTAFRPLNCEDIEQKIETAAAAIAVRNYEERRDPNFGVRTELNAILNGKSASVATIKDLLGKAKEAGLLKI